MKKILGFIILFGFVIMLGAAGSGDFSGMSFLKVLVLEIVGMLIVLFGTSALMHYKRYVKRMIKKRRYTGYYAERKSNFASNVSVVRKELC